MLGPGPFLDTGRPAATPVPPADPVTDSVTKKGPGNRDLSLSMEGLVGGFCFLSAGSRSCGGE